MAQRRAFSVKELRSLGIYDLHVHIGPEVIPRRYSARHLAEELSQYRMGAVVKNHFVPTTHLIAGVAGPEVLTGSVTLNVYSGGLHPDAVRSAAGGLRSDVQQPNPDRGRFMVWMPTISAASHLDYYGRDLDPAWGVPEVHCIPRERARALSVLDEQGRLRAEVEQVLEEVARADLILGTGHLSRPEIFAVVESALACGVRRVVITHAFFPPSGLSVEDLRHLGRLPGVFIEHCWFVSVVDRIPLQRYVEAIRAVGPEKTVLSTDGGQVVSPPIPEAWSIFIGDLLALGVELDDIVTMASRNPRWLVLS